MTNIPLLATGLAYLAISEQALPADLGPLERVVSYLGLLAMGWFFWKRETGRTDRSIDDLKSENKLLKQEIKLLQRDIRSLLENRTKRKEERKHDLYYADDENYIESDDEEPQE